MRRWLKQLLCWHLGPATFVRNIYGDEINQSGCRSIWTCDKCGQTMYLKKWR